MIRGLIVIKAFCQAKGNIKHKKNKLKLYKRTHNFYFEMEPKCNNNMPKG